MGQRHAFAAIIAATVALLPAAVSAQTTPVEIREKVQRPVTEIQMREETETVVKPEYVTKMTDVQQVQMRPVARLHYQPRVHNWWNPFAPTYTSWQPTVITQWEPQVVNMRVPVTATEYKTETRVVQRPTRVLKMVEEEQTRIVHLPVARPMTQGLVHMPYAAPTYVISPAISGVPAAPVTMTPATPVEIATRPYYGSSIRMEDQRTRGGMQAIDAGVIRR
ncbi:hypothetical protein [Lignipirellula cremea]|uniref:Uncharacterized protein n=1 Tax=Lignipirellula cremea TaxID=2528010 RepID=A0A518DTC2_9BACT|nr:hypothetical protein [Lignipirellula cremea]QDU95092.1 hypothetical protein Pla8534_29040 [Lignipirellula cremea]